MKILSPLLILGMVNVAVNAEEFTIQLLTAYKKNSMERVLEKARNAGVAPEIFVGKDGCYILTTGTFKSRSKAKKALLYAKTISSDAFIRATDPTRVPYVPNLASIIIPVEVKYNDSAVINKHPSAQLPSDITQTTAIYLYDCTSSKSGIVIPSDEQASDIIVQYNCK